jgi:vacuolar-type H+-ATPase subunit I/STV1
MKIFNKKVLVVLAIIGIISMIFVSSAFANSSLGGNIINQARDFVNNAEPTIPFQTVWEELKPIASILMGIGIVVLVCVGSVLGIKYMTSGVDEKANVKQKLIWYCVATALIVSATQIFNIVVEVASLLEK